MFNKKVVLEIMVEFVDGDKMVRYAHFHSCVYSLISIMKSTVIHNHCLKLEFDCR